MASAVNQVAKQVNAGAVKRSDSNRVDQSKNAVETDNHASEVIKAPAYESIVTATDYANWLDSEITAFAARYHKSSQSRSKFKYKLMRKLGRGGFGIVLLVQTKSGGPKFAMKVMSKAQLVENNMVSYILAERRILSAISHPLIISLIDRLKDNGNIYLILPFIECGNLFSTMRKTMMGHFDITQTRFYIAQVFLAFEYLHSMKVVYRDLKPENLMLDKTGYVKLVDLGFAKLLDPVTERTFTKLGTPDYMAPEIFRSHGYGFSVDWWAFGCLIFEFLTGAPPFYVQSTEMMHKVRKIMRSDIPFPSNFDNEARVFVSSLCEKEVHRRLGCQTKGFLEVRRHAFFRNTNFHAIFTRKETPPIKPDDRQTHFGEKIQNGDLNIKNTMMYASYFEEF